MSAVSQNQPGRSNETSHFEGRIAMSAADAAQGRDEYTQREPATFGFDLGGAWLVASADRARTGPQPGDDGQVSAADVVKPAILTSGLTPGRQILCKLWQTQTKAVVSVGLSAQCIYQDLVGDHGFAGSY